MTAQAYRLFPRSSKIPNQNKPRINQRENTIQPKEKNPHAVALGRMGGLKGGKARAAKLTAYERTEIAKKAANARWSKKK